MKKFTTTNIRFAIFVIFITTFFPSSVVFADTVSVNYSFTYSIACPSNTVWTGSACVGSPSSISGSCPSPGTSASISWASTGAPNYSYRIDDTTDGWIGGNDFYGDTTGTSFSFTGVPGRSYSIWVHSRGTDGAWSEPPRSSSFSCANPPVNGGWSAWSAYGACSVTACGTSGTQTRTRVCNNPAPAYGGADCSGLPSESISCSTAACPTDGYWSAWSDYSACSVTACGSSGTQTRTRTCTPPTNGGAPCSGSSSETISCSTAACPTSITSLYVTPNPSPYGNNPTIVFTSTNGYYCYVRHDWVQITEGYFGSGSFNPGAQYSPGVHEAEVLCYNSAWATPGWSTYQYTVSPQIINGGWSDWSAYSACSVTACGQSGTQTRTRTCTNPAPSGGGADCSGPASESISCSTAACPTDGYWSAWSDYSACSVTACGQSGTQTRTRTCTPPQNGGAPCSGPSSESIGCSTAACPATASVSVSPNPVGYGGNPGITLSSTNGYYCHVYNDGADVASGYFTSGTYYPGAQYSPGTHTASVYCYNSVWQGSGWVSTTYTVGSPVSLSVSGWGVSGQGPGTTYAGAPLTFSWGAVAGATSCSLDYYGAVSPSGGSVVMNATYPGYNRSFALTCTGPGGSTSSSTVSNISYPPAPTSLTGSCNATGTSATINWTAPSGWNTFYTRVTENGGYIYPATDDGATGTTKTFTTVPGAAYSWWIHTRAANGAWSDAIYGPSFTCPNPVPIVTLSITDGWAYAGYVPYNISTYAWNDTTVALSWSSTNATATTCTIYDNGVPRWSGAGTGSVSVGAISGISHTYTAYCSNPYTSAGSDTRVLTIPTAPTNPTFSPTSCANNSLTLSWNQNAGYGKGAPYIYENGVQVYSGDASDVSGGAGSYTFTTIPTRTYTATLYARDGSQPNWPYSPSVNPGAVTCPAATGSISASPSTCIIAADANSCTVNLTWTTSWAGGTTSVTTPTNVTAFSGPSGTNQPYTIGVGTRTFYLYKDGNLLGQVDTSASCMAGTFDNGTGTCVTNVCPNMGNYATIPPGYFQDSPLHCVRSVCPNLGNYLSVPSGYFLNTSTGNCDQYVCTNFPGGPYEVMPAGFAITSGTSCGPSRAIPCQNDYCSNINDIQSSIPAGWTINATGICVPPAEDVCPNIFGVQTSVPENMGVAADATCVAWNRLYCAATTPPVAKKPLFKER